MILDVQFKENALELNAECREHVQTFAMGFDQAIGSGSVSDAQIEKVVEAYLTESDYLKESDLENAVDDALRTAKESGEFDGKDGEDGKDGYTPVKGVDYFDGEPGEPGYTPVKGTDYFTETDKAELVAAVLENFIDVSEVGM